MKPYTFELSKTINVQDGDVNDLAFTPDGKFIIAATHRVTIWNLESKLKVRSLGGNSGWIQCITITNDGQLIAAGGDDGILRVWNVHTGDILQTMQLDNTITSVAITPDRRLVLAGSHKKVVAWFMATGEMYALLEPPNFNGFVNAIEITPDNAIIIAGGSSSFQSQAWAWNLVSRQMLYEIPVDGFTLESMAMALDGNVFFTGSDAVRAWNVLNGAFIHKFEGDGVFPWAIVVTSDGKHLVGGCADEMIRSWVIEEGSLEHSRSIHEDLPWKNVPPNNVYSIAVSRDMRFIASGSFDGIIRIWESSAAAAHPE